MKRFVTGLCFSLCLLFALGATALAAEKPIGSPAQMALNAAQALIDQQLGNVAGSLSVLAESLEVQSLDWDTMQPLLAALQEHSVPGVVWFTLPDGTYYTVDNGKMEQTLSDRAYFEPLMSGEEILGEVVTSKSSGQLSAVVAVPVRIEGQVMGALGASVFADGMAEKLSAAGILPADMSLAVLMANNQIVFTIPAEDVTRIARDMPTSLSETGGTIELEGEGKPISMLDQVSAFNGWHYVIAILSN